MVKRNFQRTAYSISQDGAFPGRYNRQSKTTKKRIKANARLIFTQIRQIEKLENQPLNMFAMDTSSYVDNNMSYQIAASRQVF